MKKKLLTMIAASAIAMVLMTGCGTTADKGATTASTAATTQSDAAAQHVIKHSMGETTVPTDPKKVAVFDMGVLDILATLEVDAELAVPVDSLPGYLSKFNTAVNAGGIKEPDMEALFTFAPDVIFISGRQGDYYEELSKIAPTVFVDLQSATYMEDLNRNVNNIAAIFNKTEQATASLTAIEEKVASVKELAEDNASKALIILTNDGSISAYGAGSRFGLIHDVLGVKTADENIEVSTHGQEVNFEYISKIDADILFVVDRTTVVGGSTTASATLDNQLVNDTKAAKNDKIVYLDAETWYLSGGGIQSVASMIAEVEAALK